MKKHILCFGDSNTHGYCADPADSADGHLARFNESERWTRRLGDLLGEEYLVIEEGLSGRTTSFEDPCYEGLCGVNTIYPILMSHEPLDLVIIMLGTNDTKSRIGANAYAIGLGLRRLINKAKTIDCWGPGGKPNLLVMAPPPIGAGIEATPMRDEMGRDAREKSLLVAGYFKTECETAGVHFLNTGDLGLEFNEVDFMHLTRASHAKLADALAEYIPTIL